MLHDIFISYRRVGGKHLARLIRDALQARGYSVFLDVDDLESGRFDEALVEKIKEATDFVLILTPGCLKRCKNEDDWLRKEIRSAFQYGRNIVVVRDSGFKWPLAKLPDDISLVSTLNGPPLDHELFAASIDKLASQFLNSKPAKVSTLPTTLHRLSNVKYRVKDFVGRADELEALNIKFSDLNQPTIVILKGLGSIGKTSIAAQYATISKDKYAASLFVYAHNDSILKSSFSDLFELLCPEEVLEGEDLRIKRVMNWLMGHDSWLLIIDNADDPEVVTQFFADWDWPFDRGHILITSRRNFGGWQDSETILIHPFKPNDAVDYLYKRTNRNPENTQEAERKAAEDIAKELGYLPLALEQAAARIAPPNLPSETFHGYLNRFRERRRKSQHLIWLDEKKIEEKKYQRNTPERKVYRSVYTTWDINFDEVRESASGDLLKVLAFLDPDSLSSELIVAAYPYLTENIRKHFESGFSNSADELESLCRDLFQPLLDWSLIEWNDRKRTYSIHRLVQEVVYDHIRAEARQIEEAIKDA